jgi:hypothetical protein
VLSFGAIGFALTGTRIWESFSGSVFLPGNVFETTLVSVPCLVSELQEPPLPGHEPRRAFRGYDLRSCNFLFKTNNFGLGLASCLVTKLLEPPSPRLELNLFGVLTALQSLHVLREYVCQFGANWFILSGAVSEHTHNFIFLCKIGLIHT